ncbi:hypothetical protein BV25DRAFT_1821126 [Artomyces pyxidatus]|uniref:Uncharacterized protein n=1 Tax=Artomyces pyxidatus TaxID=48021 RepID=A0ACB8TCB7_9AGAM|nr:hypothetical protein BV25DRAFT_1821126 [Artomyces pyxidatus]
MESQDPQQADSRFRTAVLKNRSRRFAMRFAEEESGSLAEMYGLYPHNWVGCEEKYPRGRYVKPGYLNALFHNLIAPLTNAKHPVVIATYERYHCQTFEHDKVWTLAIWTDKRRRGPSYYLRETIQRDASKKWTLIHTPDDRWWDTDRCRGGALVGWVSHKDLEALKKRIADHKVASKGSVWDSRWWVIEILEELRLEKSKVLLDKYAKLDRPMKIGDFSWALEAAQLVAYHLRGGWRPLVVDYDLETGAFDSCMCSSKSHSEFSRAST